jgi:hypothetical protein
MAQTAREFIELVLREVGVTGVGQTPLDQDINDAFTIMNRMLAQWQKRRWLVPNLIDVKALGNSAKSNQIGPGGYYNAARPDKIQAAYFKQLGSSLSQSNVSYPLTPIWSYEDYADKIQLKELNTWPTYYFYDAAFPYGNVFIWPIPDNSYEIHLILKGPIGFTIQLASGSISAAGLGYVDGAYLAIPFTNVSSLGGGGTADVTVAGGVITAIAIHDAGDGYKIADLLSLDNALMGGTGAGFLWTVNTVTSSLDSEFNMPPEYEEAIHYNLCIRLTAHYQYDPNPVHGKLALIALNTIKVSNTQVSQLQMPSSLRFGGNGGFYIFNADQNR